MRVVAKKKNEIAKKRGRNLRIRDLEQKLILQIDKSFKNDPPTRDLFKVLLKRKGALWIIGAVPFLKQSVSPRTPITAPAPPPPPRLHRMTKKLAASLGVVEPSDDEPGVINELEQK